MRARYGVVVVFAAFVSFALMPDAFASDTGDASSEEAQQIETSGQSPIVDEVRVNDGSVYRGTIVEYVAGQHVVLQSPTGAIRSVPVTEIVYAGRIGGEPSESIVQRAPEDERSPASGDIDGEGERFADVVAIAPATYRLQITNADGSARLHIRRESLSYASYENFVVVPRTIREELCATPCDIEVAEGSITYHVMEEGRRRYVRGTSPIYVDSDTSVELERVSRRGQRIGLVAASVVLFGLGAVSAHFAIESSRDNEPGEYGGDALPVAGAIGGFLGGAGLIVPAVLMRDKYRHRFIEE